MELSPPIDKSGRRHKKRDSTSVPETPYFFDPHLSFRVNYDGVFRRSESRNLLKWISARNFGDFSTSSRQKRREFARNDRTPLKVTRRISYNVNSNTAIAPLFGDTHHITDKAPERAHPHQGH